MQSWLKFISKVSLEVYYLPRYVIQHIPPDCVMVNVRVCTSGGDVSCDTNWAMWKGNHFWKGLIPGMHNMCTPNGDKEKAKTERQDHTGALSVLVREWWTLFEAVCATRNKIVHSKDSIGVKARHEYLNEQLLDYKYNVDSRLHYVWLQGTDWLS